MPQAEAGPWRANDFKGLGCAHHHPPEDVKATPLSKLHSLFLDCSQNLNYTSRYYYNILYYDGYAGGYLLSVHTVIESLLSVEKH